MQRKAGHRPILLRVSPRSTMAKHSEWVTASEIGTYVYCEEAWRLTHGLKIPPGSVRALRRGTETHAAWQRVERLTARLMRAALIVAALALAGILLRAYLS